MEIVFYDIETTIPPSDIIEFGAIVLDKRGLYEKEAYSTLIRSDKINQMSVVCNGITSEMVKDAPEFKDVAENIFAILDGRIWAGHNIDRFDNIHIKKAFQSIGLESPKPLFSIDTLSILRSTFGKRAGDMKMASLGNYFGLGQERHRAIEDVRMTIDVLKNCSMIMLLEEQVGFSSEEYDSVAGIASPTADTILDAIRVGMNEHLDIWISYNGGSNPLVPRRIQPVKWVYEPWMLEAFCYQSQMNKNFTLHKIIETRNEEWSISRSQ